MMNDRKNTTTKDIGATLKEWIENSEYSKAEVARMLGVSPQYINGLCQGKPIGKGMANKLANLFGLSEYYLLTGEGSITANEQYGGEYMDLKEKCARLEEENNKLKEEVQKWKDLANGFESLYKESKNKHHDSYISGHIASDDMANIMDTPKK